MENTNTASNEKRSDGSGSDSPSIIFFMVDQLSEKWVEAAEAGACPLPNLAKLKKQGVSFSRAISSNPLCCPARATLATGLTTRGHGLLENGYYLDPSIPTFMQALQKGGWRTGALGKVHFRPHFSGVYPDYKPYGFDVTRITEDVRGGEWLDWVRAEHPDHFDNVLATIWPTEAPDYACYGPSGEDLRSRIEAIRKDFNWDVGGLPESHSKCYALPFPEEVSQTNWITSHALDFIKNTPASRPICAHISYVQPHTPFCAPKEYLDCVDETKVPKAVPPEWESDPNAPGFYRRQEAKDPGAFARKLYFADMVHLDRQLGQVLDALEETGRAENSYIIFLSDHGEMIGDHGMGGKGSFHYDACIRVPLTICGPGLQKGVTCEQFVQLEDICPTVLELTGQALPPMPAMGPYLDVSADEIPTVAGRSLVPLCQGKSVPDWRPDAYSESYNNIKTAIAGDWSRTVRTDRFRYSYYPKGNGDQLFDLENDPDETRNLVANPAFDSARRELRDRLLELVILQDDPHTRNSLFALGVH